MNGMSEEALAMKHFGPKRETKLSERIRMGEYHGYAPAKLADEVAQLETDNAALKREIEELREELKSEKDTHHDTANYMLKQTIRADKLEAENATLKRRPAIKISDGDVWLVFPDALLSIEGICGGGKPGPIVTRNIRRWRNETLTAEEQPT